MILIKKEDKLRQTGGGKAFYSEKEDYLDQTINDKRREFIQININNKSHK